MSDKAMVKAMGAKVGVTIGPDFLDTATSFYDALIKLHTAEGLKVDVELDYEEAVGVLWALRALRALAEARRHD